MFPGYGAQVPGASNALEGDYMFRSSATAWALLGLTAASLSGCGLDDPNIESRKRSKGADATKAEAERNGGEGDSTARGPRLAKSDTDQVLSTLVVKFGEEGMTLTNDGNATVTWVVDMEEREKVEAGVAPKKYLRVKGDLTVPMDADNKEYDVGCLFVELKDNVYYREKTWLRLATTGIMGKKYQEVELPISVDLGGWKRVPKLEDSVTLQQFAGNTLKKFDATLCFRLDFTNAPAQLYGGELIFQYLRPGASEEPVACDKNPKDPRCAPSGGDDGATDGATDGASDGDPEEPPMPPKAFACTKDPLVLKAKQTANLTWVEGFGALAFTLKADPSTYKGALGAVIAKGAAGATYTAPDKVPSAVRIIISAKPVGTETLPAFCEVKLVPDEDIVIGDDGETQGLTGNVFKLAANTQKLPDLDKMTPVAAVIAPNLDIPERAFSSGFPGVKDLFEWFAIKFRGRLIVDTAATCSFKLTSDDGANLYIGGNKIVDNDGVHPTQSRTGSATLGKGQHDIRIDYYQGPRYHITLQLLWKCGNATDYSIVPPSAFVRPLQ